MKTTIESYQNQSQKQSKTQLTKRINRLNLIQNYSFRLAKRDKLSFDGFKRCMKRIEALIIPLHDLRMLPDTQDKSNIETIKTQIKQTIKKRSRNTTLFKYVLFLHTVRKITTEKLLSIANKKRAKTDTLKRVHTLLVYEHNRLNNVA